MSAAPAISIESLHVRRGGKLVLPGISLNIAANAVTGLLGPSGCGKTTLMRSIVGVQKVVSGQITVLGLPAGSAPLRRRVGYMTQAPSVYQDLTVHENLRYFARVLDQERDRIESTIATVELEECRDQLVRDLSGGQRARVSLATALLGRPRYLVLDEPTVGLDPVLRASLWSTFHELARRDTGMIVSSHVMDEAANCDSLLLMREGQILAAETPDELRRRTGTQDLSEAFLRTIKSNEEDPA